MWASPKIHKNLQQALLMKPPCFYSLHVVAISNIYHSQGLLQSSKHLACGDKKSDKLPQGYYDHSFIHTIQKLCNFTQ